MIGTVFNWTPYPKPLATANSIPTRRRLILREDLLEMGSSDASKSARRSGASHRTGRVAFTPGSEGHTPRRRRTSPRPRQQRLAEADLADELRRDAERQDDHPDHLEQTADAISPHGRLSAMERGGEGRSLGRRAGARHGFMVPRNRRGGARSSAYLTCAGRIVTEPTSVASPALTDTGVPFAFSGLT